MKNNIFNFNRFGKYFVSDLRTCWANYGLSLMVISLLIPTALYLLVSAFQMIAFSTWSGPGIGLRAFAFGVAMLCMVITMPVKCYGRLTEKQYGSFWLTLPASRLEKFISMVIMTCIVAPLTGIILYLGADIIICTIDNTCGNNLVAGCMEMIRNIAEKKDVTINLLYESLTVDNAEFVNKIMKQMTSPWLYIDDAFGITLPFLLGAIFFKNAKTVKTFIALFALSAAASIVFTPIATNWAADLVNISGTDNEAVSMLINNGVFNNLVLIDTISDTVVNLAFMIGIWFRIKTLKH